MRSVYCVKEEEPSRPFKIELGTFANSLITVFDLPQTMSTKPVISTVWSRWFSELLKDEKLKLLWREKSTNYDSWLLVLFFLIHEEREELSFDALPCLLEFSRFSPKFVEADCIAKYQQNLSAKIRSPIQTIRKWVKMYLDKDPKNSSTAIDVVTMPVVSFEQRASNISCSVWPITYQQARVCYFATHFCIEDHFKSVDDIRCIASLLKYSKFLAFEDSIEETAKLVKTQGGDQIPMPYDHIGEIMNTSVSLLVWIAAVCLLDLDEDTARSWLLCEEKEEQLFENDRCLNEYVTEADIPYPMQTLGLEEECYGLQRMETIISCEERSYEFQLPYYNFFVWLRTEAIYHNDSKLAFFFLSRACSKMCKSDMWFRLLANAKDDNSATRIVLELYPFWLVTDGMLYVFDDTTGMWTSDKNTQIRIITRYDSFLKHHGRKNDNNYANYNCKLNAILKRLEALADHDSVKFEALKNTSIGKLLFANGVWHGKENIFDRVFIPEEEGYFTDHWRDIPLFTNIDLYFFARIKDDFPETVDVDVYNDVAQTMFYNMHGREAGLYHMEALATALLGEKYKGFYVMVGEPNSGKSTEKAMLECVFGGYCGTGNIEEFAHIKDDKRDGSLKNSMVVNNWFRRLLLFSESSENTVSSESLKQHSSGGEDKMLCRVRYQESALYDIHYIMFFYVNAMFKVTNPNDPAFIERAKILPWDKSFVDDVVDPTCQMAKRTEVWFWKNDVTYRQAYCRIILDAYTRFVDRAERLPLPAVMKNATEFQVGHVETNREFFEQLMHHFIFDGRETSIATREDMQLICDHIGIDLKKMGMKLGSILNKLRIPERTVAPFVKKFKGKSERWWKGMRLRTASNYAPGFIPQDMADDTPVLTDFEQWRVLMERFAGVISYDIEQNLVKASCLVTQRRELSDEELDFVVMWGCEEHQLKRRKMT
jgi:hypothetical protein